MKNLPLTLLLLPAATTAQTLIRVCGSDYGDASYNCTTNPGCPTGDGCPPEKDTCFALPEDSCRAPPTGAPIVPPLQVCGMDIEDAKMNCGRLCEGGCDAMEACFNVMPTECVDSAVDVMADPVASPELIMEAPADTTVCGLSFADAATNCETNTPCSLTGNECATGEACFRIPPANCSAAVADFTEITMNTTAPVAESESPAPTESPVKPTHIFVCGEDYGDAERNCNTNTGCPTGDGCIEGTTCFAVPYANCRVPPATTVAATTTAVFEESTQAAATTVAAVEGSTVAAVAGSTVVVATADDLKAEAQEEPNLFFCGESYELAEQNCFTNIPCPAGGGCPQGQACFGIPSECKSPEPTVTISEAPSESPDPAATTSTGGSVEPTVSPSTSAPTKAPVVNTHFCGTDYTDASTNCDFDRACPGGFECPSGQTCFTGITCEMTTSDTAGESTPAASPSPSVGGTSTASDGASVKETVNLDNLLVFRYCGFSPDDARANCATATPCLDGTDDNCPTMQTCFELEEACSIVPGSVSGGDTPAFTPVTSTSAPTVRTTDKPVFDPSVTSFCGVDYNDAQDNCYYATPCPGNSNAECDNGETCFPGITTCEIPETPPPTPAVTEMGGGNETNAPVPVVPTVSPTPKPQYDLSGFGDTSSGRDGSGSIAQRYSMKVLLTGLMGGIVAAMM